MADVTLTAELRANIDNLERNVGTAVRTVTTGAQQIDVAAGRAAASLRGIAPGSNQAAFALTNLGRVAQDAPFGFIGIQNNINPLLESFQRLRAESGSNSAALRSLGQSLIGPAGLGIAISLITAGITFWIQHQQKAAAALKNTKKAGDEYVATLSSIRQAELKGAQDGAAETTRMDLLYRAVTNTTLSLRDRNAAYDELSEKYPTFFNNADRENTLLGKNYDAYNRLSTAIISAAQAKAYENKIGELSNKSLENDEKLLDLVTARAKARKDLNEAEARQKAAPTRFNIGAAAFRSDSPAALQKTIANSEKAINDLLTTQAGIRKQIQDLGDRALSAETAAGFKTGTDLDDKNKKLTQQKTFLQQLEEQLRNLQSAEAAWVAQGNTQDFFHQTERERAINSLIDKIAELKAATDGLDAPTIRSTTAINTPTGPTDFNTQNSSTDALNKAADAMRKNLKLKQDSTAQQDEYNKSLKLETDLGREAVKVFGSGLSDAFQSALQGTQSFISAIGQFLVGLVTKLLAAAAAAAILAVILSAVGFGAGIGGAVTAAGSFKNIFAGLSGVKLAEGGITNGPTFAMIGEGREREVVAPLSKFDAMVSNRAANGGGQKLEPVLIGGDLLLKWVDRAQKSQSRRG